MKRKQLMCDSISVRIGEKEILEKVSLTANQGDLIGLIGPNGSGKSTLLRSMANLLPYKHGSIRLNERELQTYTMTELAKLIGYVPQDTTLDFDFLVKDIVLMGRHAYIPRFGVESDYDYEIVEQAMHRTNIAHLADRSVMQLSGGQRQMVFIAKALAQQSSILLLDEPTSALDIYRELHVFEVMKQLTKEGITVITAIHDLNLASRFCDEIVLLTNGEVHASGRPKDVFTEQMMKDSYYVQAAIRFDSMIQADYVTAVRRIEMNE